MIATSATPRGCTAGPHGTVSWSGPTLRLAEDLERIMRGWAQELGGEERRYGPVLRVADLHRVGYFSAFPHHATFPVAVEREPAALRRIAASGAAGCCRLDAAEADVVLTPAACYHCYVDCADRELPGPLVLSTANTCWRREEWTAPLERQWAFTMREIVCIGTAAETAAFLDGMRSRFAGLAARAGLTTAFAAATDPFFDPSHDPRFLAQHLGALKSELVWSGCGSPLAIGSLNHHREAFGRAFAITRDGAPAWSACAAIGVERWIKAIAATHGADAARWPHLQGT